MSPKAAARVYVEDAPNYKEGVSEGPLAGGPPARPRRLLAATPAASEGSAGYEAEQQDHDGGAKNRRENRDAPQRQLRGDHEMQDVNHQPCTDQPGDDRTQHSTGHAAAHQSFADQSGDGTDQEQDDQMRKRHIKPPII